MTGPNSSRKRQRSVIREGYDATTRPPGWDHAIDTLLERLRTIRAQASALRDEQSHYAQDIQQRETVRETALRVAARVNPPPPSEDVDAFSKGVRVETNLPPPDPPSVPPLPAMKLLTETDPPEKLIHEQSIIVRAQAINRKNAELARERLPKQPEAQRNKTFHDCFLEEAVWMANDFREERKWKMHMAKKVSKLVQQYHAQRESRRLRAIAEERQRLFRLAASMARDVRRFWNQIQQIADYRQSVVEGVKRAEEEQRELERLLQRTARYTSIVGKDLTNFSSHGTTGQLSIVEPGPAALKLQGSLGASEVQDLPEAITNVRLSKSDYAKPGSDETGEESMAAESDKEEQGECDFDGKRDTLDDESTLIAAEAEQQQDEQEVTRLENEANMSIEDLLRSRGIDLAAYKADNKTYTREEDEESVDSVNEEETPDDESTIQAAEEFEVRNEAELDDLKQDASASVADILKSQGIDPEVYRADTKRYTRSDSEASSPQNKAGVEGVNGNASNLELKAKISHEVTFFGKKANSSSLATNTQKCDDTETTDNGRVKLVAGSLVRAQAPNSIDDNHQGTSYINRIGNKSTDTSEGNGGVHAVTSASDTLKPEPRISSLQHESMSAANSGTDLHRPKSLNASRIPVDLLRGTLRSYQKAGMEWLISLFNQRVNGILADEMGLGKTIQAISLLAWLAVEKGVWGPHLVVVPTSVIVNWEVEFKKWLPGFKVLTYFGSVKERRLKRQGWTKANIFHVCITSYSLAVQDAAALRRKRWVYLILDEAHNIKNFESQRWQTLLSFSSQRRLLITGTPLQNSVMELWSLMHFLMPDVFESHSEFKIWFSKPLNEAAQAQAAGIDERTKIVSKLHEVLRPFLLRRLKADVERGLPPKHEHVVRCPLSKRQRQLYEDFMANSDVRRTLQSGDFFSVMNILMQLRKVCNHPDLFEGRRILSPLAMRAVFYPVPSLVTRMFEKPIEIFTHLDIFGFNVCDLEKTWSGRWHAAELLNISAETSILNELLRINEQEELQRRKIGKKSPPYLTVSSRVARFRRSRIRFLAQRTGVIIRRQALFGEDLRTVCSMTPTSLAESIRFFSVAQSPFLPSTFPSLIRTFDQTMQSAKPIWERFVCCTTKVVAPIAEFRFRGDDALHTSMQEGFEDLKQLACHWRTLFRPFEVRSKVTIPDIRLVQWDCGKLQVLDKLLRALQSRGSRTLIFTQMTKVLDVLESFLNLHSLRYLRLDGTTKTDDRQKVVERFNSDERIFCMILTTRAGGVGLNLTGADTVIFYDTDYNPAVDIQAQDRVHRIGQTKPVHIYRLVSEQTVEENILRRANEKRSLESMVISEAGFTPEAIASHQARTRSDPSLNQATGKESLTEHKGNSIAAVPHSIVRNGKPGETVFSQKSLNGSVSGIGAGDTVPETLSRNVILPVYTSSGEFKGIVSNNREQMDTVDGSVERIKTVAYQDVTSKLLAAEDDREKMALSAAEQELRDLRAEFDDTTPSFAPSQKLLRDKCPSVHDKLEASLTPVQRYALRLIESRHSTTLDDDMHFRDWEEEFTVDKMLSRRNDLEALRRAPEGVVIAAEFRKEERKGSTEGKDDEDDDDPLTYDLNISDIGQRSYLKALTDTDADIKLYLPLRDGGPEELRVSTVVSGTAAAGLECAEDAAFFPHAYNRMSRTMYATQRQKEKARENLRKRKAEKEARKMMELEQAAAAAAAEKERELMAASNAQTLKTASTAERLKAARNKTDSSRATGNLTYTKKNRGEGSFRIKGASGLAGSVISADGLTLSNNGLFKKITKKTTRRLISAGKAALGSNGGGMPGEGTGLNNAWTKEEDMSLIGSLLHGNSNMLLLSDSLQLDPCVRAGIRRRRGYKHCVDRLVQTLQKEAKSGPPTPKATERDADLCRKHLVSVGKSNSCAQQKPPKLLALPPIPTERHPSQVKVTSEAVSKMVGKFTSDAPPTLSTVALCISLPKQFQPGYKSTETTPEALYRKRYPFIRSPRDDTKAAGNQRSPPSGVQSGGQQGNRPLQTHLGSLEVQFRSTARLGRLQNSSGPRLGAGSVRAISAGTGSSVKPKVRGIGQGSGSSQATANPQHAPMVKKDVLKPVTSGRMSIGHIGKNVSIPKSADPITRNAARKLIVNKTVTKIGGHVKGGKSGASVIRLPAVGLEDAGPNGLLVPAGMKLSGRSTTPAVGVGSGTVGSSTEARKTSTEPGSASGVGGTKAVRKENGADVTAAKSKNTTATEVKEKEGGDKGAGRSNVQT